MNSIVSRFVLCPQPVEFLSDLYFLPHVNSAPPYQYLYGPSSLVKSCYALPPPAPTRGYVSDCVPHSPYEIYVSSSHLQNNSYLPVITEQFFGYI